MRHRIKRRSVLLFGALLFSSIITPKVSAMLNGNWNYHSSAATTAQYQLSRYHRIIDGNKYVYFMFRGVTFDRNSAFIYSTRHDIDPIQVFRYDKSTPWASENIKQISGPETTGFIASIAEYNPRLGLFVVIYDNNKMDLIYDDGRIINSDAIFKVTSPRQSTVAHSITFDPEEDAFYVASNLGYQKIDAKTGENIRMINLDKKISWAGRVGDKMILFGGDTMSSNNYSSLTYCIGIDESPSTLNGKELKISNASGGLNLSSEGYLQDPQGLMPVNEDTFVAFSTLNNEKNASLIKVTLSENGNSGETLVENATFDDASLPRFRHLFMVESRFNSLNDGYLAADNSNIYLIKDVQGNVNCEKINKSGLNLSGETNSKISSVDGKTFWFHKCVDIDSNPGVYSRQFAGEWKAASDAMSPNAPVSMFGADISWSPKYGMLFRGPGSFFEAAIPERDFFYSYKNGVWTDRSHCANPTKYNYYDITPSQRTIGIDPINEDMIWSSGLMPGLMRLDLGDYENFFMYGPQQQVEFPTKHPGFFNVFENQPHYPYACNFSNVSFDADNTMWFTHDQVFSFNSYPEYYTGQYLRLMYLTADERKSMEHIGSDASKVIMPHEIRIPHKRSDRHDQVIAMRSPGNETYIAHTCAAYISYWRECLIYDHNGTPDDTSDDRYVQLENLYDEDGNPFTFDYESAIYEDTYYGDLWIATQKGIIMVNPTRALNGDKTIRRLKITKRDGMDVNEYPFEAVRVYNITDDKLGRKWISSEAGLFCLSRDSRELLGHYTVENSPLPDNVVYGVGCDMETGSVFAVTAKGITEFQPEDTYTAPVKEPVLTVWPLTVGPDYHGHINITGADPTATYIVSDAAGKEIKTLGKPQNGSLQWDITDNGGNSVENGRYEIHRQGENESHRVNILR